eukprot:5179054-Prymnesium_polylepis.1
MEQRCFQGARFGCGAPRSIRIQHRPEQRVCGRRQEHRDRARHAGELVAILGVQVAREEHRHLLCVVRRGEAKQLAEDAAVLEATHPLLGVALRVAREVARGDQEAARRVALPLQQRKAAGAIVPALSIVARAEVEPVARHQREYAAPPADRAAVTRAGARALAPGDVVARVVASLPPKFGEAVALSQREDVGIRCPQHLPQPVAPPLPSKVFRIVLRDRLLLLL